MSEKKIAVKVQDLTKTFKIPLEASNGLKQKLINTLKGRKGYREFSPLKGISFEIEEGDFFGIVGRNGSGKSTLLKSIAGIYTPEEGLVQVNGKLVPFIELGVGFNPELTGRENVFLNGALLGFSHKQMEAMYDDIVEFAELEDFMEERLKNYSSGMQVRLAFSIAIRAEGDILLLDEVLAVGDEAFQRKCFEYFAELKKKKKTVILVTHSMESVSRFCNKAMLIDNGSVLEYGAIQKVVSRYVDLNLPKAKKAAQKKDAESITENTEYGAIQVSIDADKDKSIEDIQPHHNTITFTNEIVVKKTMQDVFFGFTIRKSSGEPVFWYTTEDMGDEFGSFTPGERKKIIISIDNIFGEGAYYINVSVKRRDRSKDMILQDEVKDFSISGYGKNGWMLHPKFNVEVVSDKK
ncbi:MAG: ABC transporter ATP-binding protein [Candidatus Saccharimonadales bacterium]